jgi:uncharacterized membrane protein
MRLLSLFFRRETAVPVLALSFASLVSGVLVVARILSTGNLYYGFLLWNLFLAWLPLVFAVLACDNFRNAPRPNLRLAGLAMAWLLFFPNAPYIFTDLIHLHTRFFGQFWIDLATVLTCALTGWVLGFVSLYLMQSIVSRMFNPLTGWLFTLAATGLGSFGIYLGRFWRFNSWDVVAKPAQLFRGLGAVTSRSLIDPGTIAFPLLFAAFLLSSYLMLYALTHLSPADLAASAPSALNEVRSVKCEVPSAGGA